MRKLKYEEAKKMIESGDFNLEAIRSSIFEPKYFLRSVNIFPALTYLVRRDAVNKLKKLVNWQSAA